MIARSKCLRGSSKSCGRGFSGDAAFRFLFAITLGILEGDCGGGGTTIAKFDFDIGLPASSSSDCGVGVEVFFPFPFSIMGCPA